MPLAISQDSSLSMAFIHGRLDDLGMHTIEIDMPVAFIQLLAERHEGEAKRFHVPNRAIMEPISDWPTLILLKANQPTFRITDVET